MGGVETEERSIRLAITKQRNTQTIGNFVLDNFYEWSYFTHDGWGGYSFLNNNLNYIHETHNHGVGNLVIIYILQLILKIYEHFKKNIISIYGIMQKKNFPLFLREEELRFNLLKKSNEEKINTYIERYFQEIYILCPI